MKNLILIIFLQSVLSLFVTSACAGEIYIIANPGKTISPADVKDIFTGEKTSEGTQRLVVVDNKAVLGDFVSKVILVDEGKYASIWAKKSFRDGISIPKAKANDNEVIEFVKSTAGGVGYVSLPPGAGVTVVTKF